MHKCQLQRHTSSAQVFAVRAGDGRCIVSGVMYSSIASAITFRYRSKQLSPAKLCFLLRIFTVFKALRVGICSALTTYINSLYVFSRTLSGNNVAIRPILIESDEDEIKLVFFCLRP